MPEFSKCFVSNYEPAKVFENMGKMTILAIYFILNLGHFITNITQK